MVGGRKMGFRQNQFSWIPVNGRQIGRNDDKVCDGRTTIPSEEFCVEDTTLSNFTTERDLVHKGDGRVDVNINKMKFPLVVPLWK